MKKRHSLRSGCLLLCKGVNGKVNRDRDCNDVMFYNPFMLVVIIALLADIREKGDR